MEFSSLEFLFRFLPIFLIIYYLVPVKYKNPVLFFGSLVFYAMGNWKDALLLLFSMSLNYILVLLMDHISRKSSRNTMLVILLCYNIGLNIQDCRFRLESAFILLPCFPMCWMSIRRKQQR